MRPHRGYDVTSAEFRHLREQMKLSVMQLAWLLDVKEQTIRNIESGGKEPGRQMGWLMRLLTDPHTRMRAMYLRASAEQAPDLLLPASASPPERR